MCSYILNRLSSKQNIFSKKLYMRLKRITQKRIYVRAEPIHIKCIKYPRDKRVSEMQNIYHKKCVRIRKTAFKDRSHAAHHTAKKRAAPDPRTGWMLHVMTILSYERLLHAW